MDTFVTRFIAGGFAAGEQFAGLKFVNRAFYKCVDIGRDGRCHIIFHTARTGAIDECMRLIAKARELNNMLYTEYNAAAAGAAIGGHIELCKILIESNDDRCGDHFRTMLTCGTIGGHIDVCRFAREHGADNIIDVVMHSARYNRPELMEFAMTCYAEREHEGEPRGMLDDGAIFDIGIANDYYEFSDEMKCIVRKYCDVKFD